MIDVVTYQDENGKYPFQEFLGTVRDKKAIQLMLKAVTKLAAGNPGNVKPLGGGLSEHKIKYGGGYRIYFYNDGQKLVILLSASTKSAQKKGIDQAKEYLKDYKRKKAA